MDTANEFSFFQKAGKDIADMVRTDYIGLSPQMTVSDALCHIRKSSAVPSALACIFVTDKHGTLLGSVDIVTLLRAKDGDSVSALTDSDAVKASTTAEREEILRLFSQHALSSLPIVDACGRLCGVITAVGGGVIRDIMSSRIPAVLTSDFYATASLFGALLYLALLPFEIPFFWMFMLVMAFVTGIRLLAIHYKVRLPVSGGKTSSILYRWNRKKNQKR